MKRDSHTAGYRHTSIFEYLDKATVQREGGYLNSLFTDPNITWKAHPFGTSEFYREGNGPDVLPTSWDRFEEGTGSWKEVQDQTILIDGSPEASRTREFCRRSNPHDAWGRSDYLWRRVKDERQDTVLMYRDMFDDPRNHRGFAPVNHYDAQYSQYGNHSDPMGDPRVIENAALGHVLDPTALSITLGAGRQLATFKGENLTRLREYLREDPRKFFDHSLKFMEAIATEPAVERDGKK